MKKAFVFKVCNVHTSKQKRNSWTILGVFLVLYFSVSCIWYKTKVFAPILIFFLFLCRSRTKFLKLKQNAR